MHQKHFKLSNQTSGTVNIHNDADHSVFDEIFIEREYRQLEPLIKNAKGAIIDVGAHIGMFSIFCRLLNKAVPIFAFEPEQENYSRMQANLKLNHLNVTTKNQAVSDQIGMREIYLHPDSHNHSLYPLTEKKTKINSTTLEKIFQKFAIDHCDLLKLDCEGAEFIILPTLPDHIFKRINNIYLEYHEYDQSMDKKIIHNLLQRHGFKIQNKPSPYQSDLGFIFASK